MCNNPNLNLVNINAYTKFGNILSICSHAIIIGILLHRERNVYYIAAYDATVEIPPIRNIECLIIKMVGGVEHY